MIFYNPTDGEASTTPVSLKPRTCFLMTKLGNDVPSELTKIRESIAEIATDHSYSVIDASSIVGSGDYLIKIWKLIQATPLSIAIHHSLQSSSTAANIFYELGVAQAMGSETLIIKQPDYSVPSDLIRNEYINFDIDFEARLSSYFEGLEAIADHYETVAENLENNPVLSIDYYRRAFLLTGSDKLRKKVAEVIQAAGLSDRAKNSVEQLSANF